MITREDLHSMENRIDANRMAIRDINIKIGKTDRQNFHTRIALLVLSCLLCAVIGLFLFIHKQDVQNVENNHTSVMLVLQKNQNLMNLMLDDKLKSEDRFYKLEQHITDHLQNHVQEETLKPTINAYQ